MNELIQIGPISHATHRPFPDLPVLRNIQCLQFIP